jgi:hypothetical protein
MFAELKAKCMVWVRATFILPTVALTTFRYTEWQRARFIEAAVHNKHFAHSDFCNAVINKQKMKAMRLVCSVFRKLKYQQNL